MSEKRWRFRPQFGVLLPPELGRSLIEQLSDVRGPMVESNQLETFLIDTGSSDAN